MLIVCAGVGQPGVAADAPSLLRARGEWVAVHLLVNALEVQTFGQGQAADQPAFQVVLYHSRHQGFCWWAMCTGTIVGSTGASGPGAHFGHMN